MTIIKANKHFWVELGLWLIKLQSNLDLVSTIARLFLEILEEIWESPMKLELVFWFERI